MAISDSGPPTGGLHDRPLLEPTDERRDQIASRLELRDVASVGDDLAALLRDGRRGAGILDGGQQ